MAHSERAWHGLRLVATRKDGVHPKHTTVAVLREDGTRIIGRRNNDMHLWISRVHLLVELATSPVQLRDFFLGYVNVLGQNGTIIDGVYHPRGTKVPLYVGSDIELAMGTEVYYRVAYL